MIDEIFEDFIKKYITGGNSLSTVYGCMAQTGAFKKKKTAVKLS